MRVHLALIWIVAALTLACASPPPSNSPPKPDEVVLEIINNAGGMVYPKEGDILTFRLYESGRFEYDDYPAQDPPRVTSRNVVITRKEATLSADEVEELIGLAEQPDFHAAKENYPGLPVHTDSYSTTTITFTHQGRKKKISAGDFWGMLSHPENRAKYPPSMVRLLERVQELKAKAIGKS